MSCRDARAWSALLEHRLSQAPQASDTPEPAEWAECADHLASCAACRRIALAIDPTLVFQRLAEPVASVSSISSADIDAMRQAVAGLRRARSLGATAPEAASSAPRFAAGGRGRLVKVAAAAALVLGLGSQLPLARHGVVATAPLPAVAQAAPVMAGGGGGGSLGISGDVGRPSARVYQIAYRDMAVVMVVDKSLDL